MSNKTWFEKFISNYNHTLFAILAFMVFTIYIYLSAGFVTLRLWEWFVEPLGVPPIRYAHGIGIYMTLSYLTRGVKFPAAKDDTKKSVKAFVLSLADAIMEPWLVLAFASIVKGLLP